MTFTSVQLAERKRNVYRKRERELGRKKSHDEIAEEYFADLYGEFLWVSRKSIGSVGCVGMSLRV